MGRKFLERGLEETDFVPNSYLKSSNVTGR